MPRLGAHLSIAGGLPRAVDRAEASGCEALQIFTKTAGQWRARDLPRGRDRAVPAARATRRGSTGRLARQLPDQPRRGRSRRCAQQSIDAMGDELDRAEALGLDGLVMHPGSYTTGTEEGGLRADRATALAALLRARPRGKTMVLLEHTAGQGTNLGHRFEHLAAIIDASAARRASASASTPATCSPPATTSARREGYATTFEQFDAIVGFDRG